MTNDEQQIKPQDEPEHSASEGTPHKVATSLGAIGGGVAGAAIGRAIIGGKAGAAVGAVAGAITGGIAGEQLAELPEEIHLISEFGLGADHKPIELPPHYSWEELQALSKPQS